MTSKIPKNKMIKQSRMIKKLRLNLGLTQEQFAARLGVNFTAVNRWENGRGSPSPFARWQIEELMQRTEGTK